MKEDLIYHVVPVRKWRDSFKNGRYLNRIRIDDETEVTEISCYTSEQVSEVLNRSYPGRKDLLLIVIDSSRIQFPVETRGEGDSEIVIKGPLNGDAILDKIKLQPDENREFRIEFDIDV